MTTCDQVALAEARRQIAALPEHPLHYPCGEYCRGWSSARDRALSILDSLSEEAPTPTSGTTRGTTPGTCGTYNAGFTPRVVAPDEAKP